jgi:hypothetical protein
MNADNATWGGGGNAGKWVTDRNGRAGLGWGGGDTEKMCTMHAVTVWWFWH